MDDLEKLLADEEKETPPSSSGEAKAEPKEEKPNPEVLRKQEELDNLNKALAEAQIELRRVREEKKKVRTSQEIEEDELPKIDM